MLEKRTNLLLTVVLVWHGVMGVVAPAGAILLFGNDQLATWLGLLAGILLLLWAAGHVGAAVWLGKRQHRGRTLSLAVNYIGFLVAFLGLCHQTGLFVGIDGLADKTGRSLPFLLLVAAGYFVSAYGDRYEQNYRIQQRWQQAGRTLMVIGGLATLLAMGLLGGMVNWLSRLGEVVPAGLLLATFLFAFFLWAVWRAPTAVALNAKTSHEQMLNGYLFLSPNLLGFLFFFAGPLILSFYTSFTNWDAFGTRDWVGLDNYATILDLNIEQLQRADQPLQEVMDVTIYSELSTFNIGQNHFVIGAADKLFWLSLKNTLTFALISVPLSTIIALLLANLLNSKLPGMKIFRAIYFLPSIAAVVGIALVWQWLYNATIGYINYFITIISTTFGTIDPQIRWLSESQTALLAIIIVSLWQTIGFNTVLFLAGLQTIPGEMYEAATIDGAGKWAQFRHVTIPLLAPTTFFVVSTTTIQALQIFEQVFILTNPVGGPNNSTLTLTVYLYQNGFQFFKQGYGSAIAWLLFVVIFGITLAQFRRQQQNTIYEV